jgi:hypothetical protein
LAHATSDPQIGVRVQLGPVQPQVAAGLKPEGVSVAVNWSLVEPCNVGVTPECTYDWSELDADLDQFVARGVRIQNIRVTTPPPWASPKCAPTPAGTPPEAEIDNCPVARVAYPDFQAFVSDLVNRYGAGRGNTYNVPSFALWNEPNKSKNWGGETDKVAAAREYGALLHAFATAIHSPGGNPNVSVEAGEIAAGGPAPRHAGSNGAVKWAKELTAWMDRRGYDDDYKTLNIHAYSQYPSQIPTKIESYWRLPGKHPIAVTEFGWAVRGPNNASGWRCVNSEAEQAARFQRTVNRVRAEVPGARIVRLVWFNALDNVPPDKLRIKCPNTDTADAPGGWYTPGNPGRDPLKINTFGLFKRPRDGSVDSPEDAVPRCIAGYFEDAQDGTWSLPDPMAPGGCP